MTNVKYEISRGDAIIFVAEIAEYGPVQVKSSRRGIFSCRVADKRARDAALKAVEHFADDHDTELQPIYDDFARAWSGARVA